MTRTTHINPGAKALFGGLALSAAFAGTQANAGVMTAAVQPFAATVAVDNYCATRAPAASFSTPSFASQVRATTVRAAKSAAILGNEMSALDKMRAQQAGAKPQVAETVPAFALETLAPASKGIASASKTCGSQIAAFPNGLGSGGLGSSGIIVIPNRAETAMPTGTRPPALKTLGGDNFLASKRIKIGKTSFDRQWKRVRKESVSRVLRQNFGSKPGTSLETIADINRWVNRKIDYTEDRELFGKADHWAGARRTLALGKGDCEDYALTKMQLLAAAGVARKDMYLSIVKDTIRGQDHAFLVVRHEGQYLILDNATDKILDGSQSHDYKPILSFNSTSAWLHGY